MNHLGDRSRLGEPPVSPTLDELTRFLQESIGPGIVKVLISEATEPLACVCTSQPSKSLSSDFTHPTAFEIRPVSRCTLLSQGVWNVLCQRGTAPQVQGDILCAAASVEGIGSLAIQAEITHFGRQDFRYRRFCCSALYLGLLSAINLLKLQRALGREHEREEQARHLVHSNALARNEEREHLSLQLHDSVIQNMVSAFHMVEAIRETSTDQSEQGAILQKAEEALSQAIRELRGVINTLHTATPAKDRK